MPRLLNQDARDNGTKAPPDERGGKRIGPAYDHPPHLDSTFRANPAAIPTDSRLTFAELYRAPWKGNFRRGSPHGCIGILRQPGPLSIV
jgi:hypothetical protein